jgi:protoporphyrinogen oxidase
MSRRAIIIGAGPAGLTAAYELLTRTDIVPVILEQDAQVGGLSKTVVYKGNRMDIGGHRFFSKSDRVMAWWLDMLPLEARAMSDPAFAYPANHPHAGEGADPERDDRVMMVGVRRSRIFFAGKFFEYPISLSPQLLFRLGLVRSVRIASSYLRRALFPLAPVENLEQFMINRFGDELYHTFFASYTEKVWGVPCRDISANWGAQRIKDVSVARAILDWLQKRFGAGRGLAQKDVSTSMIERYLYPKFGPGQMWEEAAHRIEALGGQILHRKEVVGVRMEGGRVAAVEARDVSTGEVETHTGDLFFSTMPVRELIGAMGEAPPPEVRVVAGGLQYRDFMAVGLLVKRLKYGDGKLAPDSWLYIQEPKVLLGRMQIYNNWSRYMIADPDLVWLGLEYFCNKGDALWNKPDAEMVALAADELASIGLIDRADVVDGSVQRMEKAYPGYFGSYARFPVIRKYVDSIENLFLIGRNGMHRYNNQDHSMLTAMAAVDNLLAGVTTRDNLWAVNSEEEYLEEMGGPSEEA